MTTVTPRHAQQDPLQVLADHVTHLVDPILVDRRLEWWTPSRHRATRIDTCEFPSLLDQLRAAVVPAATTMVDGGRRPPTSRPAANLGAVDALRRVECGVLVWRYALDLPPRGGLEGELRALVGVAGGLDRETLDGLVSDVGGWWRCAVVAAGVGSIYRLGDAG